MCRASSNVINDCLYFVYFVPSYVRVEKLADGDLNELFVPLLGAAAVRGEVVSIAELKIDVAKALEALIAKLHTKSKADWDITLINDQQNKQ